MHLDAPLWTLLNGLLLAVPGPPPTYPWLAAQALGDRFVPPVGCHRVPVAAGS